MSLHPHPIDPIPDETTRVARAAFLKGNAYMRMRNELGVFYHDEAFAALFPARGQPAESPWRLALILVMQFAEGLSDRQTALAVRSRIDWKYALSLELTDPGFDYSILSEFRDRLIAGNAEQVLLERMLACFKEQGLLTARGRQRTDSSGCPLGGCWPRCGSLTGWSAWAKRSAMRSTVWPSRRPTGSGHASIPCGLTGTVRASMSIVCPRARQSGRHWLTRLEKMASASSGQCGPPMPRKKPGHSLQSRLCARSGCSNIAWPTTWCTGETTTTSLPPDG